MTASLPAHLSGLFYLAMDIFVNFGSVYAAYEYNWGYSLWSL